jgi:GH15 family glucan-1,4-alpha-glucosidase
VHSDAPTVAFSTPRLYHSSALGQALVRYAVQGAACNLDRVGAFPAIGKLGFLSNRHDMALVGPDGNVELLSVPRPDAPTVFGSLLDRGAGRFALRPLDPAAVASMDYDADTMTLRTTWTTPTGSVEVRDVLATRADGSGFRADHVLVRSVRGIRGSVDMSMVVEPRPDYGRGAVTWTSGGGVHHAGPLRLRTDLLTSAANGLLSGATRVSAGEQRYVALAWDDGVQPRDAAEAAAVVTQTSLRWAAWARSVRIPSGADAATAHSLRRDALTLEGLRFDSTGAILAAATFGLPEVLGGSRNWDYRLTWWRDASMTAVALARADKPEALRRFLDFAVAQIDPAAIGSLPVMVRVDGGRDLTEHELPHLSGYGADSRGAGGAKPVRIGNGAAMQRQTDIPGWMVLALHEQVMRDGAVSDPLWRLTQGFVEEAARTWHLPDQGIWESRGPAKHYVSSKLLAWAALDRGAEIATLRGDTASAARWRREARTLHAEIMRRGLRRGVFRQSYDSLALDASTLLMAPLGFLPAHDRHLRSSIRTIDRELGRDGGVRRYKTETNVDGLNGQDEGTFTIASWWLVQALAIVGDQRRARELFDILQQRRGVGGLQAEEIDAQACGQLGNTPQAYSHLGALEASETLMALERRLRILPAGPGLAA